MLVDFFLIVFGLIIFVGEKFWVCLGKLEFGKGLDNMG